MFTYFTVFLIILGFILFKTIVIVSMRENFVVERLGKFSRVLKPGIHFLVPFFDRVSYKHEMREEVFDIPSQTCITQDNMQIEVDGLVYLKVMDAKKASYGIGNYRLASINLAQTTMRSEVGKLTLSKAFSERDSLNEKIVKEVDFASDPWGIKVLRYEIKNIRPSSHVMKTLEKQMEAERSKRAEITLAQADKLSNIILSEGQKIEAINISEGEKQKRINEALGKAEEIRLIADATAQGAQLVAAAIKSPGGTDAVKLQLTEQFIEKVSGVYRDSKISVLPEQMGNMKAFFEGADKVTNPLNKGASHV
ncbi:MAG: paraslipin [Bacteriovoracaceae bacterium]|jgi:regulator of protease activity HflC (stomatin/prohibitin superfamily)|nr:paraslipin [Bacteriovoracaceae bacterium]